MKDWRQRLRLNLLSEPRHRSPRAPLLLLRHVCRRELTRRSLALSHVRFVRSHVDGILAPARRKSSRGPRLTTT
jgi:hypothetical protein